MLLVVGEEQGDGINGGGKMKKAGDEKERRRKEMDPTRFVFFLLLLDFLDHRGLTRDGEVRKRRRN